MLPATCFGVLKNCYIGRVKKLSLLSISAIEDDLLEIYSGHQQHKEP